MPELKELYSAIVYKGELEERDQSIREVYAVLKSDIEDKSKVTLVTSMLRPLIEGKAI